MRSISVCDKIINDNIRTKDKTTQWVRNLQSVQTIQTQKRIKSNRFFLLVKLNIFYCNICICEMVQV